MKNKKASYWPKKYIKQGNVLKLGRRIISWESEPHEVAKLELGSRMYKAGITGVFEGDSLKSGPKFNITEEFKREW